MSLKIGYLTIDLDNYNVSMSAASSDSADDDLLKSDNHAWAMKNRQLSISRWQLTIGKHQKPNKEGMSKPY